MKRRTIREAAIEALKQCGKPLSAKDIYNYIISEDLYRFNAINPENIVRGVIRRQCEGLEFPTAYPDKFFQILRDGKYWIKGVAVPGVSTNDRKVEVLFRNDADQSVIIASELLTIHNKHKEAFRKQIL